MAGFSSGAAAPSTGLKGTKDVRGDVAIMRELRRALPDVELRVDPNAAWSVPDSIRAGLALEEFAPAVRLGAVDVIHGDVYKWGGIAATTALAAHCETFGLGMNLHSGGELGIATACTRTTSSHRWN